MVNESGIKAESDDDLLFSYLNEDCLSTDPTLVLDPPSPPYSTSSTNTSSPPTQQPNDFLTGFLASHGMTGLSNGGWPADTTMSIPQTFPPDFIHISPYLQNLEKTTSLRRLSAKPALAPKPAAIKMEADEQDISVDLASPSECDISSGTVSPVNMECFDQQRQQPPQQRQQRQQQQQQQQQQSASTKRQQRLIKNRAAALLSRKRKREYVNSLEEQRTQLLTENETLKSTIKSLESKVSRLSKENADLKRGGKPATAVSSKAGVVFMIFFFSFALFSFPSQRSTTNSLAVGGYASSFVKKHTPPMIASGTENVKSDPPPVNTSVFPLVPVQTRDLQTWILKNFNQEEGQRETGLIHWVDRQNGQRRHVPHAYLYADEFSRVPPLNSSTFSSPPPLPVSDSDDSPRSSWPTLSLLSPLNKTLGCASQQYLQIDVQVLNSHIVHGHLPHCVSTTPDHLEEMIGNASRTATDRRICKDLRRKAVDKARAKSAARVIVQQPLTQ